MRLSRIETRVLRQPDPERKRQWFHAPEGDLIVDSDRASGEIVSMHLDWDVEKGRRLCASWDTVHGLRTGQVDTGEELPLIYKRSPVVTWDSTLRTDVAQTAAELIGDSEIPERTQEKLLRILEEVTG
ncbi:MAG: hypothetical protein ACYTAF_02840 [Planctomycetota bacterium]|jgi:hypothetical protein